VVVAIGQLDARVVLKVKMLTRGSAGGFSYTDGGSNTVWASVTALSGRDLLQAQQRNAEVSYRVEIRYRSDIDAKTQVVWEGRTLEAVWVDQSQRRRGRSVLFCKERTD